MKILMTADTIGGVWTFTMELAQALNEKGFEIALATMGRLPSPDQRLQAAKLKNVRLFSSDCKLEWMNNPWADVQRAGRWLLKIRDQFHPDVVHLNAHSFGSLPWHLPVVITTHSCMTSWWHAIRKKPFPSKWERYRQSVHAGLHAANEVVTPTHAMAELIQHIYQLPKTPHIIPNGRDSALFTPGPKHPFVFSAGRFWDEAKNLASLDAVAARLSWPIYVAGPLQHPDRLVRSPATNARLLGTLPLMHMRQWMSRADIYALPARYEPFGLSVLEAALAQCALVLGDIPSLREIWHDAAIFVPPDDTKALQDQLQALIKDPPRRRQLAVEAHARALRFTPQHMAAAYANLYRNLAKTKAAAPHRQRSDLVLQPS